MPSPQVRAQQARTRQTYQFVSVVGASDGVDLRQSPTALAPGRSRKLVNWSLREPGNLLARQPWSRFSSTSLGAAPIQGAGRIYLSPSVPAETSTVATLVAWASGLYYQKDNGTWDSTTPSLTGLSSGDIFFVADRDLVVPFDGSTMLWKSTGGGTWTHFGLTRPSGQSSLSSGAGGTLLGATEYEVNFTYKDRDLPSESNGSSAASTYTMLIDGSLVVQCPNSTDVQVDAIVVYARNKTSGETVRRKASSLVQSTGASSTIVISSSNWGANVEEPTDHDPPTYGLTSAVVWKNRWWGFHKNRLYFTQIFQPQSWPSNFYIEMPFGRGEDIRALQPQGDALIILGDTRMIIIVGQTSLDFEVRPALSSQDGALGVKACTLVENQVIHAGAVGIWAFDGVADRLLSYDIEPAWRDYVSHASVATLRRTAVTYDLKQKELRVSVTRRYPTIAPGEWILDMSRSGGGKTAWTSTDRDCRGYILWDGPEPTAGDRGRLFSWASTQGRIQEENVAYGQGAENLACDYEGPGLTLGSRQGRWVDVRVAYEPNDGMLTEVGVVDGTPMPSQTIPIGASLPHFDVARYDVDGFGGSGRRQAYSMHPLQSQGRTYTQKVTYTGQSDFRFFGYDVGVVPEPASRGFTE